MNTKQVGEISEACIIADCLRFGYSVSKPFGDNQRYDLILDLDDRLYRVQCKTGRIRNGAVEFPVCSTKNYNGHSRQSYVGQIELIFVYCPDNNTTYWLNMETNTSKTSASYRVDEPEYIQTKMRFAKDFLLEDLSDNL